MACLALLAPTLAVAMGAGPCEPDAAGQAPGQALRYGVDELAQLAARQHASVAVKRAALEGAKADWDAARAQYFPTPSLQSTPNAGGGHTTVYGLQQPLWTGGRLTAGVEAAAARTRSAAQGVLESRQGLGFAVANAYQALLQARGRVTVWRTLLDRMVGYRDTLQRRIAGGVSAPSEMELLQARHAVAASQLKSACFSVGQVRNQLTSLAGVDLARAAIDPPDAASDLTGLAELLDRAQANSPLLDRLLHDEQAAVREAEGREAALWPTLSLTVQRSVPQGVPFSTPSNTVGLQLQFTPGAGLSSLAAQRSAAAQVQAARAAREAAKVELLSRVRMEYDELCSAMARREDVAAGIRAAGQVLASYERLFVAGKRSWLDVMNAARELLDAELALADLDAQAAASRYRLELFAADAAWMRADGQ